MKTILALLLAAWSVTANANIAVYHATVTYLQTGGSAVQNILWSGYLVVSLDSPELRLIKVDARNKTYSESTPDFTGDDLTASAIRSYTVVRFDSGDLTSAVIKGMNVNCVVNTDVATNRAIYDSIPASFIVSGSDLFTNPDYNSLREYHGSMVLDRAKTLSANKSLFDVSSFSSTYEASLAASGYTAN